jgi:RNA polymerase sigma factor (sigma-70 family)
MDISLDKLRFLRRAAWRAKSRSLNIILEDNQTELGELLPDEENISPMEFARQREVQSQVEELLEDLPPKQRQIISLRFGLQGGKKMSYGAISKQCGISRERVRQLTNRAMRTLSQKSRPVPK